MRTMFMGAGVFNQDISNWDVGSVTDMTMMFFAANSFSNNDLSGWTVSNVTDYNSFSTGWGSGNTEPIWP